LPHADKPIAMAMARESGVKKRDLDKRADTRDSGPWGRLV